MNALRIKEVEDLTSIVICDSEVPGAFYSLEVKEYDTGKFSLALTKQTSFNFEVPAYSCIEMIGTDDDMTYRLSVKNGNLVKSLI